MPQPKEPTTAPEDVPLESPMPRKPWLEEEPQPASEEDIGADDPQDVSDDPKSPTP
jgi:hypothetical protein